MKRVWLAFLIVVAACDGQMPLTETADQSWRIQPRDFALLPCPASAPYATCALLVAGGKRVLLGAPEGAISAQDVSQWAVLDAVLLFGLGADEIDGLDTIRYRSWQAGRGAPLRVVGPRGVGLVADGLNLAFQSADAITFVNAPPSGGFDGALLIAQPLEVGQVAFSTGDLHISTVEYAEGEMAYQVAYEETSILLVSCRNEIEADFTIDLDVMAVCAEGDGGGPRFIHRYRSSEIAQHK